jgi:hypothetical protein
MIEVVEAPSRFEINDALWAEIKPLIRVLSREAVTRVARRSLTGWYLTRIALPTEYGYESGVTR